MANLPRDWTHHEAFEIFEYTISCLTFFQDMRDSLNVEYACLPPDDIAGLLRVGALLSICRRQVREWDRCRRVSNRLLKRTLQN